jgi:hypothetical protein
MNGGGNGGSEWRLGACDVIAHSLLFITITLRQRAQCLCDRHVFIVLVAYHDGNGYDDDGDDGYFAAWACGELWSVVRDGLREKRSDRAMAGTLR